METLPKLVQLMCNLSRLSHIYIPVFCQAVIYHDRLLADSIVWSIFLHVSDLWLLYLCRLSILVPGSQFTIPVRFITVSLVIEYTQKENWTFCTLHLNRVIQESGSVLSVGIDNMTITFTSKKLHPRAHTCHGHIYILRPWFFLWAVMNRKLNIFLGILPIV